MALRSREDFRGYLKDELESRIRKNNRYSLRAFARDLKVKAPVLSMILSGKRGISTETAVRMAEGLALDPDETKIFCDLVQLSQARSEVSRNIIRSRIVTEGQPSEFHQLQQDVFRAISDWHHYAILELTLVKDFKSNETWIARRLGISVHEVRQAIERLQRLDLLKFVNDRYVKVHRSLTTSHDIPSEGLKRFHQQILEKAAMALRTDDISERDFTTMTIALNPKKMPMAKEKIKKFRRELTDLLETGTRTEVYCLSVELFRLSRPQENLGE